MRAILYAFGVLTFTTCWPLHSADLTLELGQVRDSRISGNRGTLEIEVKASGKAVQAATANDLTVKVALDDTGTSLASKQKARTVIAEHGKTGIRSLIISAQLQNPSRGAKSIAQFSGVVDLVLPQNDPDSVIIIDPIKQEGEPVQSDRLRDAKASITVFRKKQYATIMKGQHANGSYATPTPPPHVSGRMMKAVPKPLRDLHAPGGGFPPTIGDNVVAIELNDPKNRIASIQFREGEKAIEHTFGSEVWSRGKHIRYFAFDNPLSPSARIHVSLSTEKAKVSQQFDFKDIPLP